MVKSALIGRDIAYTLSPKVHALIADAVGVELDFKVYDTPYDGLKRTVMSLLSDCDGFFVTKPYKNDIKKFLDSADADCGVNFVSCADRTGYNTDGSGFMLAMDRNFPDWKSHVNGALVIGAGGAASAVCRALVNAGKKVYVLNRTVMNAVRLCRAVGGELYVNQPCELVVNCTTLGRKGEDVLHEMCVMPEFTYAFDLNYDDPKTPMLRRCETSGAKVCNGLDMLIYQAIEGDSILFGKHFDMSEVFEKVKAAFSQE